MERENWSNLGEIEERREPKYPGFGFSKGNPNQPGSPRPSIEVTSGTMTAFFVTTQAQKIIVANRLRHSLHFQNRSAATIWIGVRQSPGNFNVVAPPITAWELVSGAVWEPEIAGSVFWDDIYAVASADNSLLVFIESIRIGS